MEGNSASSAARDLIESGRFMAGVYVLECYGVGIELEVRRAERAVAVFGDCQVNHCRAFWTSQVDLVRVFLFTRQEHDNIGVLLNGARFSKIGKLGGAVHLVHFAGELG